MKKRDRFEQTKSLFDVIMSMRVRKNDMNGTFQVFSLNVSQKLSYINQYNTRSPQIKSSSYHRQVRPSNRIIHLCVSLCVYVCERVCVCAAC